MALTVPASGAGRHLAAELATQPAIWDQAQNLRQEQSLLPQPGQRVVAIGCGSSGYMAEAYATRRQGLGAGSTCAYTPDEAPSLRKFDVVVAISRSGTTSEMLQMLSDLRHQVRTVGLVADPSSPFVDLVDECIAMPFADEESVVQTRFATGALALLRASLGESLDDAIADATRILDEDIDEQLVSADQYAFLGRDWTIGIADEAALKLREAAQAWTESYPAYEYRHGPISIAQPGRVTWAFGTPPPGIDQDVRATGAHFEHRKVDAMADLIRVHIVALRRALALGLDPDHPRNLTRSVLLDGQGTPT